MMSEEMRTPGEVMHRHRTRRRMAWRHQGVNVAFLTLVWVMLNGNAWPLTVVTGLVLALLVMWVFPLPAIQWQGRPRPLGLLMLVGRLLFDLAVASFRLSVTAFSRNPRIRSGMVRIPLGSQGDLYQVGTASILTIVPGSVVVDARRKTRTLYLHVFDMDPEEAQDVVEDARRAEMRILRAFASDAEIRDAAQAHDEEGVR